MAERSSSGRSSTEQDEDRRLVAAFLTSRGESVFRSLYRRHTPALLMLAVRLAGGDRSAAEDVIQEAWIRAVEALPSFQWRSTLRTWLSGFVVNCARESRRENIRHVAAVEVPLPQSSLAFDPRFFDVERAIARLPEGYREVLLLHDVEGFTHAEIADILDVEVGTSKSQLSHARESLRTILEGHRNERF